MSVTTSFKRDNDKASMSISFLILHREQTIRGNRWRKYYEKHVIIVATGNISSYTAHMSEQNYINNVHPNNLESSYSLKLKS